MKKRTKKIVIIIAVAILAYIVFTAFRKPAKSGSSDNDGDNSGDGSGTQRTGFPLKYGSKGKYVKALQRWLNAKQSEGVANFGANLIVDGKFGDKTLTALRLIWNEVEGYPVREVNEVQYLANDIHLFETLN